MQFNYSQLTKLPGKPVHFFELRFTSYGRIYCKFQYVLPITYERNDPLLILVTKHEAKIIRQRFRHLQVSMSMRQKSKRKKYYAPETQEIISFLNEFRTQNVSEHLE